MLDRNLERAAQPASLAELEARVRYDLKCLAYPQAEWLPRAQLASDGDVKDVVIVGAGQGGLALAFALARERVNNVAVLDRAPAGQEGPWATFARMETLRTPKYLTGPDGGLPSLTFRAWYDAQGLTPVWSELDRIPRLMWMDYLRWFRDQAGVPVANDIDVIGFEPVDTDLIAVQARDADGAAVTLTARQVVFANGIDGGGAWTMPAQLAEPIPAGRRAHASDSIDFDALRDARVAVLGIGAAALDNAATALAAGARSVTLCFRRSALPALEVREWIEHVGFLRGFGDLDDESRWRVMHRLLGQGAPPPAWSLERCTRDKRFTMLPGAPWLSTRWTGDMIEIETPGGVIEADFVIFATGAVTKASLRPELAAHDHLIKVWRDQPVGAGASAEPMADYPYLGAGFELLEKHPGTAPWLNRVRMFNWAATASLGVCASSITGMKFGLDRLVSSLVRSLYVQTAADHIAAMPWPATNKR